MLASEPGDRMRASPMPGRPSRPATPTRNPGLDIAAISALARRLGLEPGAQRPPQRLGRIRQAVLVVIPPEIPTRVVREVDRQPVIISDHRLRGAYCPAGDRVTHPDLAEAESRMRVQSMQRLEIRGPGPDTRPDTMAVALVIREEDIGQAVTHLRRYELAGEGDRVQLGGPLP